MRLMKHFGVNVQKGGSVILKSCEKCMKKKRNKPDNEFECYYSEIIKDFLGKEFSLIDCPDINENNAVDLLFNYENEYVEVELKRIVYQPNNVNFIAHDKYMGKLISLISDIIDCEYDLFVDISLKSKINDLKFNESIVPLINEIKNIDYEDLPKDYNNKDVKICIDYLSDSNCGIISEPLIFRISNPVIDDSSVFDPSFEDIKNEIEDFHYFTQEITKYIINTKFKEKYSNSNTKKIAMFIINHTKITESLIPSFNKIQNCDLVDLLLDYQVRNIDLKNSFLDNLIIVHEDKDTQDLRYVIF